MPQPGQAGQVFRSNKTHTHRPWPWPVQRQAFHRAGYAMSAHYKCTRMPFWPPCILFRAVGVHRGWIFTRAGRPDSGRFFRRVANAPSARRRQPGKPCWAGVLVSASRLSGGSDSTTGRVVTSAARLGAQAGEQAGQQFAVIGGVMGQGSSQACHPGICPQYSSCKCLRGDERATTAQEHAKKPGQWLILLKAPEISVFDSPTGRSSLCHFSCKRMSLSVRRITRAFCAPR